jgi:hypothetical protein
MPKFLYSIVTQRTIGSEKENDELAFFEMFTASLKEFIEGEVIEKNKVTDGVIQRTLQRLRGSLTPYLTTPLKTDQVDIERSLKDTIEEVLKQRDGEVLTQTIDIRAAKILKPTKIPLHRNSVALVKQMLTNAKNSLPLSQLKKVKNNGNAFLLKCTVDDIWFVPIINKCLAKNFTKYSNESYSLINDSLFEMVFLHSVYPANSLHTVIINLAVPEQVREKLNDRITLLLNEFAIDNISMYRKIFQSGFGEQYQLHFDLNLRKTSLGAIITSLIGDDHALEEAFSRHGSLVALENIP